VLDGLRALHHPLRGESSQQYIAPSLAMLREIQQTGDIFFPKRWMDATLSDSRRPPPPTPCGPSSQIFRPAIPIG